MRNPWVEHSGARSSPPRMEEFEITTTDGENVVGPVSLDQVRRGLAAGKVPATAQIRRVGEDAWHPVLASLTWDAASLAAPEKQPSAAPKQDPRIANWMHLAAAASDAGNWGEAYRYYTKVLEFDAANHEAWFGKALAAGWGSGLRGDRFSELVSGLDRAISLAPEDAKKGLAKRAAGEINSITKAYFNLSISHTAEYISLDDTWAEHIARCIQILPALEAANRLDPTNKAVIENAIELTKSMIEGVEYEDKYESEPAYKTKTQHLPDELEASVKKVMDEFVAKLQALDPTYKAPEINKAGAISATGCIGCLVIVVVLALGAFWIFKSLISSSTSTSTQVNSVTPKDQPATASSKKDGEASTQRPTPAKAPDCLTSCKAFTAKRAECVEPFTARLKLSPNDKADVIADHKRVADGRECRSQCGVMAKKLIAWGECASANTCEDFVACYRKANGESPGAEPTSAPTTESEDCTPCESQEDFDAAMKAGSKCCPVMTCTSNVDCYPRRGDPPGRVCCKIPGGQLCADPGRCKGANRVEP